METSSPRSRPVIFCISSKFFAPRFIVPEDKNDSKTCLSLVSCFDSGSGSCSGSCSGSGSGSCSGSGSGSGSCSGSARVLSVTGGSDVHLPDIFPSSFDSDSSSGSGSGYGSCSGSGSGSGLVIVI